MTVNDVSVCLPICGDGFKWGEECDDKNKVNGDGCSSVCTIENGFSCVGDNKSTCSAICGDGLKIIRYEQCDDGNNSDNIGCLSNCTGTIYGWQCSGGNKT